MTQVTQITIVYMPEGRRRSRGPVRLPKGSLRSQPMKAEKCASIGIGADAQTQQHASGPTYAPCVVVKVPIDPLHVNYDAPHPENEHSHSQYVQTSPPIPPHHYLSHPSYPPSIVLTSNYLLPPKQPPPSTCVYQSLTIAHTTSTVPHCPGSSGLTQSQPISHMDPHLPPHGPCPLSPSSLSPHPLTLNHFCSPHMYHIHTPVNPHLLADLLRNHPNAHFRLYVSRGFLYGFGIGFSGPRDYRFPPNLPSALSHPEVITEYLAKECASGNTAGPFELPPSPHLVVSPLGIVPKKGGKWRLIMHLSYPEQYSINDGINVEDFPLKYVTVYDAIDLVMILGKGSLMAKLDVKSAFRLCPVRPHDQHLLGMHWNGKFYFDRVLPFGLRSAPFIFNCLAETLEWIARQRGVTAILHYLDDFFIAGPPTSTTCQHHLDILLALCEELQVPISPEKLEGPSTTITFLGILLDTNRQEARLPPTKLQELQVKLNEWSSRSYCTKQQLQSLIGSLSFAAKVVRPGRTFLRRMIDLSKTVRSLNHHIHLTPEFRLDLDWWRRFAADWNGTTFFLHPHWTPAPDLELYTDSAGAIGFGAYYQGRWFQGRWTTAQLPLSITYKELFPIAMACHVWGSEWQGKKIMFHCDNTGVVHCIQTGTSHCPHIMSLLRSLLFTAAQTNFMVMAQHIPGTHNSIADCLSRFRMQEFHRLAPSADPNPTPIPQLLPSTHI